MKILIKLSLFVVMAMCTINFSVNAYDVSNADEWNALMPQIVGQNHITIRLTADIDLSEVGAVAEIDGFHIGSHVKIEGAGYTITIPHVILGSLFISHGGSCQINTNFNMSRDDVAVPDIITEVAAQPVSERHYSRTHRRTGSAA